MYNNKWVPCWQMISVAISKRMKAIKINKNNNNRNTSTKYYDLNFHFNRRKRVYKHISMFYWLHLLRRGFFVWLDFLSAFSAFGQKNNPGRSSTWVVPVPFGYYFFLHWRASKEYSWPKELWFTYLGYNPLL